MWRYGCVVNGAYAMAIDVSGFLNLISPQTSLRCIDGQFFVLADSIRG